MEHESFESQEIADVLNSDFVSIKVDREERPDVDRVYMTFVQATTGSGGWPMSVWLTPELQAVLRRHVLPAAGAVGPAGVSRRAARDCASLARGAPAAARVGERNHRAARGLWPESGRRSRAQSPAVGDEALGARRCGSFKARSTPAAAASATRRSFRGRASCCSCCASTRARATMRHGDMVLTTLRAMALGGMRDHIGGGFHRYSVDGNWRVPALREDALRPGATGAGVSRSRAGGGRSVLRADCRRHAAVRPARDDRIRAGGFYSAEDADSVPPEHRSEPDATQDGRRVLHLAAGRSPRGARRRQRSRSSVASGCCRTAMRRSIRRTSSPARTFSTRRVASPRSRRSLQQEPEVVADTLTRARVALFEQRARVRVPTWTTRS